jgi:hypothetical protein
VLFSPRQSAYFTLQLQVQLGTAHMLSVGGLHNIKAGFGGEATTPFGPKPWPLELSWLWCVV